LTTGIPREGRELFEHPLASATMTVLREKGFDAATVAEICARAGVAETELPRRFTDIRLLALSVSEAYVGDFRARVDAAFKSEERWPDTLRAAAYETLRWIQDYPEATWWGTVGVLEAGEVARAHRDGAFAWASGLIDAGRQVAPDPAAVPAGAPLLAVGAIVETLGRRVQKKIPDDPVEAVPRMMYAAVRPYLGEEAARRELEIPPPPDIAHRSGF
jgi:AcrR family transcriptional regulator